MGDQPKHPWVKPLGTLLGLAAATAVSSLTATWFQTRTIEADAKTEAKKEAKAETGRAEKAEALYLAALNEAIEEDFAEVDADLDALDKGIDECEDIAKEARNLANAALQLMAGRYSRSTIERTIVDVERTEPAPEPSARAKREQKKLPSYLIRSD